MKNNQIKLLSNLRELKNNYLIVSVIPKKLKESSKNLRELFQVEEFIKRGIHVDTRTFIDKQQQAKILNEAARLADDFSLTDKMPYLNRQNSSFSTRNQNFSYFNKHLFGNNRFASKDKNFKPNFDNPQNFDPNSESQRTKKFEQQRQQQPPKNRIFSPRICNYCKKRRTFGLRLLEIKEKRARPRKFETYGVCYIEKF